MVLHKGEGGSRLCVVLRCFVVVDKRERLVGVDQGGVSKEGAMEAALLIYGTDAFTFLGRRTSICLCIGRDTRTEAILS